MEERRVEDKRLIDVTIVILFVVAAAGIGYESADLIAPQMLETVTNVEALRWTLSTFSALLGLAIGLNVQVTYRRLVLQVRKTPIEIILDPGDWVGHRPATGQLAASSHFPCCPFPRSSALSSP